MQRAKGRKFLTNRRAFWPSGSQPWALAPGAGRRAPATRETQAKPAPAKPPAAKPPAQRARLPRRLAADFRSHIETRLPHLRPSFEAAGRDTGLNWRMLAALGYQESRWRPAAVSPTRRAGRDDAHAADRDQDGREKRVLARREHHGRLALPALHEGAHSEAHPRSRPHAARHGRVQHRHRPSRRRAHHHADAQEESRQAGPTCAPTCRASPTRRGTSA